MKKNPKGFTIVELLVIIGIMATILVLIIANLQDTKAGTRDRIRVANIQEIRLALEEYRARCGVYPATLELTENNGECPAGFTLGDVLREVPTNPDYDLPSRLFETEFDIADTYHGYLYAGLSTRVNGPCYEYHLGVPLESNRDDENNYVLDQYLKEDHDCDMVRPGDTYDAVCAGSGLDFSNADDDVTFGVYDFRSAKNC